MTDASTLLDRLVAIRRWWYVVLVATLLGATAGFITAPRPAPATETSVPVAEPQPPIDPAVSYEATRLLIRGESTALTGNLNLVVLLIGQGEVPARAAEALGRPGEAAAVAASITVTPDIGLGTLAISAIDNSEQAVVDRVNAYADAVISYFDERALEERAAKVEALESEQRSLLESLGSLDVQLGAIDADSTEARLIEAEINSLANRYGTVNTELRTLSGAEAGPTFTTIQHPVATRTADSPAPVEPTPTAPTVSGNAVPLRTGLGGLLGLLLGIGLAFVIDRLDTRLRTIADAETAFGLPVLAALPRDRTASLAGEPDLDVAYAHQGLAVGTRVSPQWQLGRMAPTPDGPVGTAEQLPPGGEDLRTVLLTSPTSGTGTSSTTARLARAFAAAELDVLILDCDFRSPSLDQLLDEPSERGWRDENGALHAVRALVRPTSVPGVRLLPAGDPGPAPASLLTDATALVELCREMADVVLIDTGPLLETNEAACLAGAVDAVLLVARAGRTRTRDARASTARLARLGAVTLGVAFVDGASGIADWPQLQREDVSSESVEAS